MTMSREMQLVVQKSFVATTCMPWDGPVRLKGSMKARSELWNIAMSGSKTYMCLVDLGAILGLWLAKREEETLEWMKKVRNAVLTMVENDPRVYGDHGLGLRSYPFTKAIKDRFIKGEFHPSEGISEINRFLEWICICGATRDIRYDEWWDKFIDTLPEEFPWISLCRKAEVASVQVSEELPRIRLLMSVEANAARRMYLKMETELRGSTMVVQWGGKRFGSSEYARGGKGACNSLWELPTCSLVVKDEDWKKKAFSMIVLFSTASIIFLNRNPNPEQKTTFDEKSSF